MVGRDSVGISRDLHGISTERYILEEDVEPSNDVERHIKSFIDSLDE